MQSKQGPHRTVLAAENPIVERQGSARSRHQSRPRQNIAEGHEADLADMTAIAECTPPMRRNTSA